MSPKKRSRASSIDSDDLKPHKQYSMMQGMIGSGGAGASSSRAAGTSLPASGPLVHASQDLDDFQASFWRYQMDLVEQGGDADGNIVDFKSGLPTQGQLPLARIKKVMKSDDQVKMISAEAPILFARACEIFISDLTCRAFLIAEEHKRRTIQRSDIAGAIGRSDLFDFLIDIVPRHESVPSSRLPGGGAAKREKTGEGKGVGRSNAAASGSRRQHNDELSANNDHLLRGLPGAYGDADGSSSAAAAVAEAAAAAAAASDSFNIPHTSVDASHVDVANTHSSSMANWIHDTSADEHSSQPDLSSHTHHAPHAYPHTHHQSGPHTPHEHHQQHHQPHHHAAHHHVGGHHSHHHSPLDYVTPSNAGTPNSIGAGSTNGGAWSHTFSGF